MLKIFATAKREYIEHVKTKGFIIGLLLFPIMIIGSVFLIEGMKMFSGKEKHFTILDPSGQDIATAMLEGKEKKEFFPKGFVYEETEVDSSDLVKAIDALNELVNQDKLFSFFVVAKDPVLPEMNGDNAAWPQPKEKTAKYYSKNLADEDLLRWCSRKYSGIVKAKRLKTLEISEEKASILGHSPPIDKFQVQASVTEGESATVKEQTEADIIRTYLPIGLTYLLCLSIMIIGGTLLTNTIEEKSNRIFEVLLSSMSPFKLMVGKILGIAGMGLTMLLTWFACFLVFFNFILPKIAPEIPIEQARTILTGQDIFFFAFFFVGGFFVFSSIYMGLGSLCSTIKEAQNFIAPLSMVMMVPFFASFALREDPNGTLGVVLSYIPVFTPFIMMIRATAVTPAPTWEIALGIVIIMGSVVVSLWAAGKVFRVGILMSGKPPKIREVIRWIRAK